MLFRRHMPTFLQIIGIRNHRTKYGGYFNPCYNNSMPGSPPPKIGSWPWLRERLFPRGTNLIQWASFVILISMLILYVLDPPKVSQVQYISTLMAVALLMVINILLDDLKNIFPNEQTSIWFIMFVSAGLTFYAIIAGKMFQALYIILMISAQANAMLPSIPAMGFSFLLAGAFLGVFAWAGSSPAQMQGTAIGMLIGMTFTITLSQVLLRYSEQTERANHLLEQLKQVNTELLAARQKEKEFAIAEERVRLARDLHDGLGHHLTAMSIQLQAAEKMVRSKPDAAAEAVHHARDEIQAALKEVRQSVAALREAPVDYEFLPQTIERLADESGKRAGLEINFFVDGKAVVLGPAESITLYRTAQEGLTNVLKHAVGANQVQIRLVYQKNETLLSIEDNGTQASQVNSQGFGLSGLRERAALLGGQLECGQSPGGGFRLVMRLPYKSQTRGQET